MRKIFLYLSLCLISLTSCEIIDEILPGGIQYQDNPQYIAFCPESDATTGFIYYPGAAVAPESYNAWMEDLARLGYCVIVAKMPLNLAVLDVKAALRIRNKFPEVEKWVIGGHSLGGAMTVQLIGQGVADPPFEALILTGAYPGQDISDYPGKVLSLYASNDEVSSVEEINDARPFLPPGIDITSTADFLADVDVFYHLIEGGNHAQFGDYGVQQGDGEATISADQQQYIVVDYINTFLSLL